MGRLETRVRRGLFRLGTVILAASAALAAGCISVTVSESVSPDHPANPDAPVSAWSPPPDELQRAGEAPVHEGREGAKEGHESMGRER